MAAAKWRWLLVDVVTLEAQAEIPAVGGLTFGETLGGGGTFQATIPLIQPAGSAVTAEMLLPPRAVFAVEKDGVILWAGPIWTHKYDLAQGTVDIAGEAWLSYLRRRVVRDTVVFAQVDQALIAKTLVDTAQAVPGGHLGIDTATYYAAHSKLRDRPYYGYEGKVVGTLLEQLGAVRDGFDLRLRPRWSSTPNSTLVVDLVAEYPPTGRETNLVFELGATCEIPTATLDGTNLAYWVRALGKGEGDAAPTVDVESPDRIAANILLEAVTTHGDVSELPTLTDYANRALDRGKAVVTIPEVVVGVDMLGGFTLGDLATVRADYGLFEVDDTFRLVAWNCDPVAETVRIQLAPAELFNAV